MNHASILSLPHFLAFIQGSKEHVAKIRRWATTYGNSTRQLSVRAKSTKDNPGTLPINAYGRWTLLNPAPLEDLTERIQDESETDEADERETLLVGRNVLKRKTK